MYTLIIVIHVLACAILIASILLQSGRGGGLSEIFSGGASQTIFGARASTFLTRTTTAAAVAFLLTCISLTVLSSRRGKSLLEQVSEEPLTQSIPQAIPEHTEQTQEAVQEKVQEENSSATATEAESPTPQE